MGPYQIGRLWKVYGRPIRALRSAIGVRVGRG